MIYTARFFFGVSLASYIVMMPSLVAMAIGKPASAVFEASVIGAFVGGVGLIVTIGIGMWMDRHR